jgi:hypothetical protein
VVDDSSQNRGSLAQTSQCLRIRSIWTIVGLPDSGNRITPSVRVRDRGYTSTEKDPNFPETDFWGVEIGLVNPSAFMKS